MYYVLLIPGSKATVDWDGSSDQPGPTQAEAYKRCSMVITEKSNLVGPKALTFAHELGHAHGLSHAPCGDAAEPDKKYPYPNANIGVQGYNVFIPKLFPSSTPDIMSYCDPAWISDFHWNKLEGRVRVQTSWDTKHEVVAGRSLRGIFREPGEISWGLVRGEHSAPHSSPVATEFARAVDGKRAGEALPIVVEDANHPRPFGSLFDSTGIRRCHRLRSRRGRDQPRCLACIRARVLQLIRGGAPQALQMTAAATMA